MNKLKIALAKMMKRDEDYELQKVIEKINKRVIKTSSEAFKRKLAYVNPSAVYLGR
jgi:hypothetical protein